MHAVATTHAMESTWSDRFSQPPDVDEVYPSLVAAAHGRTDRGRTRPANEDHFLIAPPADPSARRGNGLPESTTFEYYSDHLLVVADGMGGHAGGAQASELAVTAVETALLSSLHWLLSLHATEEQGDIHVSSEMCAALQRADMYVCEEAARSSQFSDMGTTLTAAYLHGSRLFVAHAGDSRCYLLRGRKMYRLTQDHTLVNEMLQHGVLESEDDAQGHFRHVVTNFVGGPKPGVRVEVHRVRLAPGDAVLLCTDGLTGMLTDPQIAAILEAYPDPREASGRLIDAANAAGGRDNITAVVARCEDSPATSYVRELSG
jgi:PPM family protein phosphatase